MSELPRELRELIAAERAAPAPGHRTVVRARLAASVGADPLGHAAAGSWAGAKVIAIVALVAGAGGAIGWTHHARALAPTPEYESAPSPPPTPHAPEPPAIRAVLAPPVEPPATAPPPPAPRRAAPVAPVAPVARIEAAPPAPAAPSQIELLRRAWDIRATDPSATLALVTQDEQLHPDGALAEERDALRVHALADLGRTDAARVAAARFVARYPHSVHRAWIATVIPLANPEEPR